MCAASNMACDGAVMLQPWEAIAGWQQSYGKR